MGKYSENPLDNLQGYLENIERIAEHVDTMLAELQKAPSAGSDSEAIASLQAELVALRQNNNKMSTSMNTIAQAIGTVPTEEERNKQHQEDLEYIVKNAKKQITVGLDASANMSILKMSNQVQELANAISDAETSFSRTVNDTVRKVEEPLKKVAVNFEERIGKTVEKKAEKALHSASASVIENWFWRVLALVSLIAGCLTWLYPTIKEIDYPDGAEGFAYTVLAVLVIIFTIYGVYQWGKANGNRW